MQKTVAIVNKTAGKNNSARLWPQVEAYLKQLGINAQVHFTKGVGDATLLARRAALDGAETVLSVGGDGTLNEIINGLAGQQGVVVGVIPTGSGNDFVRTLGLSPKDWQMACRNIVKNKVKTVDMGKVNGRYFINAAGVGFDATVVHYANQQTALSGSVAYVAAVLKTLHTFKPAFLKISLDDKIVETEAWLVVVGNGQYFGGGMRVTPAALLEDGYFDVCILGNVSKPGFIRAFPSVFRGRHVHHPAVTMMRARHVAIESSHPFLAQADGEVVAQTPIEFKLQPQAIKVFA